jgi:uncharacterized coiled-coil protein SlyX
MPSTLARPAYEAIETLAEITRGSDIEHRVKALLEIIRDTLDRMEILIERLGHRVLILETKIEQQNHTIEQQNHTIEQQNHTIEQQNHTIEGLNSLTAEHSTKIAALEQITAQLLAKLP